MRERQAHRSIWRREEGQALTEFAIVVPIIVMVLLFAVWFSELVTIKLKTQEAARYAAWELTSYKLHDYHRGKTALSGLSSQAIASVAQETAQRYADLDSTSTMSMGSSIFAASWTPPVVVTVDGQEEAIYGGAIVNFIFNIAAGIIDIFSALSFKNGNYVAMALVALGKDWGGARTARMFGSSEWGFNRAGFMQSYVYTIVTNNFMNWGVQWQNSSKGAYVKSPFFVMFQEKYSLITDSWNLYQGSDVYGDTTRPGAGQANKTAFWKQVDRIYFVNKRTRGVGKGFVNLFRLLMSLSVALTFNPPSPPGPGMNDFMQTAVVSKNYRDASSGKITISQDRGATKKYDSTPVCGGKGSQCPGGDSLKPYGETLEARGEFFMGCKKEMQLGCPSATLSQDNPFGDYLAR